MPCIALVDVTGDGLSPRTSYRVPAACGSYLDHTVLMIDTVRANNQNVANMKGLIVHRSATLSGTGIRNLVNAPTASDLVALLKSTSPSTQFRNNVLAAYTTSANLVAVPAGTTWLETIQNLVDQVNTDPQGHPLVNVEQAILAFG